MPDKPFLIGLTVASGLLAYKIYSDKLGNKLSLPPSPRSYPLIGHLLSVPKEYEHLGFIQLGEQIGSEIFSLSVFGTTIIVLNNREDAVNLFDKRSTIYSDRTCPPMIQEPSLLDWGDVASFIRYGDRWRRYRRLMNPWFTKQAVIAHQESQEQAARKLIQRLLKGYRNINSSHDLEAEILLCISATLYRSLYGYEVGSSSDPIVSRTQKLMSHLTYAMLTSNYWVNTIPALRHVPDWCPGTDWNIGLENAERDGNAHITAAYVRKEALKLGLSEVEADDDAKQVLIALLGAGIESSVGTMMMFILAMVLYPEVQKKAQAELDAVIGDARLPTFEDRDQLGYIERIIQEILRWHPVTPVAVPHTCFKEDTYKGYRIPKGAIVFGNVWAITRDKSVYKDPETFDPERYLDPSTPPSPVFGWGRRRCPGNHFAESLLFITIALILTTFNIEVAQDENGKDILPSGKLVNSMALTPENFALKLTPRSAKHEELIEGSFSMLSHT